MTETDKTVSTPAEKPSAESKKKTKKEEKTFETALARLNEIVSALEDGTVPLDKSLALMRKEFPLSVSVQKSSMRQNSRSRF